MDGKWPFKDGVLAKVYRYVLTNSSEKRLKNLSAIPCYLILKSTNKIMYTG